MASAPTWNPKLAPVVYKKAGGPHLPVSDALIDATPFPYRPPRKKPALSIVGNTMIALALDIRLIGIF